MPDTDPAAILLELIELSKKHLELTEKEDWDQWEQVLGRKIKRYDRLDDLVKQSGVVVDRKTAEEIQKLEKRVMEVLDRKRTRTRTELEKVARIRQTFSGYRKAGTQRKPRFGMDV